MRFPEGQTIRVGDVVYEDGLQRGLWKFGRVERLITGKDRELFSLRTIHICLRQQSVLRTMKIC